MRCSSLPNSAGRPHGSELRRGIVYDGPRTGNLHDFHQARAGVSGGASSRIRVPYGPLGEDREVEELCATKRDPHPAAQVTLRI